MHGIVHRLWFILLPGALQVALGAGTIITLLPKYRDTSGKFRSPVCDSEGNQMDSLLAWLTTVFTWLLVVPMLLYALAIVRSQPTPPAPPPFFPYLPYEGYALCGGAVCAVERGRR